MKIDMNGLIYALSYALDCIEAELVGVSVNHAKWVAYISTLIGKDYGFSKEKLADLSACAALHDNALTQYISEERVTGGQDVHGNHCVNGEKNLEHFPFHGDVTGFILYHHENANGTGPFHESVDETPLEAQIIHLADLLDVACHLQEVSEENYQKITVYLNNNRDTLFSSDVIDHFFHAMSRHRYLMLADKKIDNLLNLELPHHVQEYTFTQVQTVMDVFGRIIDYKSPFTRNHSDQIAHKVMRMADVYGYPKDIGERLYVAGVLHDIGKMAINNDVLEKPDKLTDSEYAYMQNHAWYTYVILKQVKGFEDITQWASLHHEKLNGKGYPFGKTAHELTEKDRLMGCIDIYQALSEDRPYKPGMSHAKCIEIMTDMAEKGFIDGKIVGDIDRTFTP